MSVNCRHPSCRDAYECLHEPEVEWRKRVWKRRLLQVSGRDTVFNNQYLYRQIAGHRNEHPLLERVRDNIRLEHLLHRMKVIHGERRPKAVAAMEASFRQKGERNVHHQLPHA